MRHNTRRNLCAALALAALGLTAPAGCARKHRAIEVPDAPLGRVIIYRNGVAYFERHATVEGELVLDVPGDRVDDFLKSLTVVDTSTGESLALSYPTGSPGSQSSVSMTIALPKGRRDVRIAYVTESPAWKPSYRVVLDEAGNGHLQSWAVVDNVSNEAWRNVAIGVGSTSALSFRYDLHSVQTVERETIDSGVKLASAPPQGGSPYAIEGASVRVLADLSGAALASLGASGITLAGGTVMHTEGLSGRDYATVVESSHSVAVRKRSRNRKSTGVVHAASGSAGSVASAGISSGAAPPGIEEVVTMLAGNSIQVIVEGWAGQDDADPATAGLRRANALRDGLVARGIAAERIDVVGHPQVASEERLVRVIAAAEAKRPEQADVDADDEAPRGIAHFMTAGPMTIFAGHSAMVTLFNKPTAADRVFLYDPVSDRGSKRFAFNAVRVVNPTANTLDGGPVTVYAKQQFLGEGVTDAIGPGAAALVPFGLDRTVVATPATTTHEEIDSLRKIERGIATTETQRIRRTVVELANRGQAAAQVFVRHRVATGWTLKDPPSGMERLGTDLLIPVQVAAGKSVELVLVESTPIMASIDLRSSDGLKAVEVYLKKPDIDGDLRGSLEAIVAAQRHLASLDDTLATRRAHAEVLRTRVNELAEQLVALRKVGRAQALSGHLAARMRALGDRLDAAAAALSDLETRRLEAGIALDNLVADLSLGPA